MQNFTVTKDPNSSLIHILYKGFLVAFRRSVRQAHQDIRFSLWHDTQKGRIEAIDDYCKRGEEE